MSKKRANQPGYMQSKDSLGRTIWIPEPRAATSEKDGSTLHGFRGDITYDDSSMSNMLYEREEQYQEAAEEFWGNNSMDDYADYAAVAYTRQGMPEHEVDRYKSHIRNVLEDTDIPNMQACREEADYQSGVNIEDMPEINADSYGELVDKLIQDESYKHLGYDDGDRGAPVSMKRMSQECGVYDQYIDLEKKSGSVGFEKRLDAAHAGYRLDDLIDDPSDQVRYAVAGRGHSLESFVDDPEPRIRESVAHQGHGLDRLIHDENSQVRAAVARQGYGLEELVNDPSPEVRAAVAGQGYGLDVLDNDPDEQVRGASQAYQFGKLPLGEQVAFVREHE